MRHLNEFLYPRIIKSAFCFIVNTPVTTFRSRYRRRAPSAQFVSGRASLWDGAELAAAATTEKDKARLRAMLAECERLAAIPDRTTKEKFQELEVGIDLHRVIAEISGNAMLHGRGDLRR